MSDLGDKYLNKLLTQAEQSAAGIRKLPARLTSRDLSAYRATRTLSEKESVEGTLRAAQARGAIRLVLDDIHDPHSLIARVELEDLPTLASFLGHPLRSDVIAAAAAMLEPWCEAYPIVNDVIDAWRQLKSPRTLTPDAVGNLLDALRVVRHIKENGDSEQPLRVTSQKLFNDTKRIEQLTVELDILVVGAYDLPARPSLEVWQELGLIKDEQPALLAGNVTIRRARVCALLDAPYTGLPASAIEGLDSQPAMVLSVENLTTFHMEARTRCKDPVLVLYTAGMPSPQWRVMYRRLLTTLPASTPIYHWGDLDEGGFRIAAKLAEEARAVGRAVLPWEKMAPEAVPSDLQVPAQPNTLSRMVQFAHAAGWSRLADAVQQAGFTAEQEAL